MKLKACSSVSFSMMMNFFDNKIDQVAESEDINSPRAQVTIHIYCKKPSNRVKRSLHAFMHRKLVRNKKIHTNT